MPPQRNSRVHPAHDAWHNPPVHPKVSKTKPVEHVIRPEPPQARAVGRLPVDSPLQRSTSWRRPHDLADIAEKYGIGAHA
jgi:hypothetical protein